MTTVYTLEITNGTTTYTFSAASGTLPPDWEPRLDPEYNTDVVPRVLKAQIETWDLRDFVYVSATPGNITSDFDTLATLLRNRSSPITTATLKRDGSSVRSINTTDFAEVWAGTLRTKAGPGSMVNHWRGDLVIYGRRLLASSNIVELKMRLKDTYDEVGRHTQTLTGEIEVTPGFNVTTAAQAYALASLGATYVFTTGGGAAGGSNIDIEITNYPSSTRASFVSQQVQRMNAIPSTALDFQETTGFQDGAGGRITTTRGVARSTSTSRALTAARTVKPTQGLVSKGETQDDDALEATATYTVRAPLPAQAAYYGVAALISIQRRVTIRGGSQSKIYEPAPGYDPYPTTAAKSTVRITETIEMRCTNLTAPAGIPLPGLLPGLTKDDLQDEGEEDPPWRVEKAEQDSGDLWARSARRVYELPTSDALDVGQIFTAISKPTEYVAELELKRFTAET